MRNTYKFYNGLSIKNKGRAEGFAAAIVVYIVISIVASLL